METNEQTELTNKEDGEENVTTSFKPFFLGIRGASRCHGYFSFTADAAYFLILM